MALLNYTTQISADKTVAEIQAILARSGAMAIMTEYDANTVLVGISFKIATPFGPTAYSLPCDISAVSRILDKQARAGKVPRRLVTTEQAARVGWRIIKDWIEAQLALVQTQMVTLIRSSCHTPARQAERPSINATSALEWRASRSLIPVLANT